MAITMHEIGRCLLEMNKLTEAMEYLEKALQIKKLISLDVDKDKSVAKCMWLLLCMKKQIGRHVYLK